MSTTRVAAAVLLVCGSCIPLTPQPMGLGQGSTVPDPRGATRLETGSTMGAALFTPFVLAAGAGLRHQLTEEIGGGIQLDAGVARQTGDGEYTPEIAVGGLAGRAFVFLNPWRHVRITGGAGLGAAGNGTRYGTADVCLAAGSAGEVARVSGGLLAAHSAPLVHGRLVDGRQAIPTTYGGASAGLEIVLTHHLSWSIGAVMAIAATTEGATPLLGVAQGLSVRLD